MRTVGVSSGLITDPIPSFILLFPLSSFSLLLALFQIKRHGRAWPHLTPCSSRTIRCLLIFGQDGVGCVRPPPGVLVGVSLSPGRYALGCPVRAAIHQEVHAPFCRRRRLKNLAQASAVLVVERCARLRGSFLCCLSLCACFILLGVLQRARAVIHCDAAMHATSRQASTYLKRRCDCGRVAAWYEELSSTHPPCFERKRPRHHEEQALETGATERIS